MNVIGAKDNWLRILYGGSGAQAWMMASAGANKLLVPAPVGQFTHPRGTTARGGRGDPRERSDRRTTRANHGPSAKGPDANDASAVNDP